VGGFGSRSRMGYEAEGEEMIWIILSVVVFLSLVFFFLADGTEPDPDCGKENINGFLGENK